MILLANIKKMKNQLRIMTKVEIYYFSATGNSLAVAKDIAEQTNGTLVPIISTLDYDVVKTDADVIGFVFPIYDFKPPELVDNLIKKIPNINSKYVFAVCTYGVMPLKTMKKLEKTLKSNGGNLSGGFTVKMPHNGVGYNKIPIEKQKIMFQNWEEKSVTITDYVNNRKKGTIESSSSLRLILLAGIFIRFSPKIISMLGRAVLKGWDSLSFYTWIDRKKSIAEQSQGCHWSKEPHPKDAPKCKGSTRCRIRPCDTDRQ